MIERKFNPDKYRWKVDKGISGWEVTGDAYFPRSHEHGEFLAAGAVLLRPNSFLSEEWREGICRLAAAAPEMLKILEKIAGLLDFCELEKLIDEDLEKEIRNAIKNAKGGLKP